VQEENDTAAIAANKTDFIFFIFIIYYSIVP